MNKTSVILCIVSIAVATIGAAMEWQSGNGHAAAWAGCLVAAGVTELLVMWRLSLEMRDE